MDGRYEYLPSKKFYPVDWESFSQLDTTDQPGQTQTKPRSNQDQTTSTP
jgi:hypothetical protein